MNTYYDFLDSIEKIDTGIISDDVIKLLGKPTSISDSTWRYDLTSRIGFPGIPAPPGTTTFLSIDISFDNGSVKDVVRNWMDTTGPNPDFPD